MEAVAALRTLTVVGAWPSRALLRHRVPGVLSAGAIQNSRPRSGRDCRGGRRIVDSPSPRLRRARPAIMTEVIGAATPYVASITESSAWRRSALLVPPVFVAALLVHVFVLQRFANSGDEYAYVWQATAFSEGRVTAVSPQPAEAFKQNHLGDAEGLRYSKYPPGWPLLLALGTRVGLPGLVNPLLAALALAGIYRLACSWVGPRAAAWGTLVIGASPFFLLNAGSYHSHPSCLFALTGLALSLAWALERPGALPLFLAGLSFGLAVLIRPYTALLIGLPLIIGLGLPIIRNVSAARRSFWPASAWFALGGLPAIAVLVVINQAATGSWWTLAWSQFDASEGL